jgi:hypothetical protein
MLQHCADLRLAAFCQNRAIETALKQRLARCWDNVSTASPPLHPEPATLAV